MFMSLLFGMLFLRQVVLRQLPMSFKDRHCWFCLCLFCCRLFSSSWLCLSLFCCWLGNWLVSCRLGMLLDMSMLDGMRNWFGLVLNRLSFVSSMMLRFMLVELLVAFENRQVLMVCGNLGMVVCDRSGVVVRLLSMSYFLVLSCGVDCRSLDFIRVSYRL